MIRIWPTPRLKFTDNKQLSTQIMHSSNTPLKPMITKYFKVLTLGLSTFAGVGITNAASNVEDATKFKESIDGVGHFLVVPYYTAQPGFATLINLVNGDRNHGKVVKVRFRGASNADEVYNFTLFLRAGDVWAGEVSHNPATGLARLSSPDESCTLPRAVSSDFSTTYVNPSPVANHLNPHGARSEETLEGYVEVITMADINSGTELHNAITHTNSNFAPCRSNPTPPAIMNALLTEAGIREAGLAGPTTGLMGRWSIFNVSEASSWSGRATALVGVGPSNIPGAGKMVMFPQTDSAPSGSTSNLTSDPLLRSGAIAAKNSHFPDLSTPYLNNVTANQQAAMLSAAMAKTSLKNEYFTDTSVNAQTDWVVSLPMLRYSVALNYSTGEQIFTPLSPEYHNPATIGRATLWGEKKICQPWLDYDFWDRWGNAYGPEDEISIGTPSQGMSICGAVSVIGQGVLTSKIGYSQSAFSRDGWGEIFTPGINEIGIPILGSAFAKATSTNVGANISGNFGITWEHSYSRPGGVAP